jgi:heat-inducible transcriptional repressor
VVTRGGHVESRLLNVEQAFTLDELERISSYCSHSFRGLPLAEIRRRLLGLMAEERVRYDRLLAGVIELGERVTAFEEQTAGEVFLEGAENLLDRVQPRHLQAVREVLAAFVDKARLVSLLNQLLAPAAPRVLVGSDFSLDVTGTLGMVVSPFELATGESGLVGVIGLKRMNYPQIIPVVDYVGTFLAAGSREEWRRSVGGPKR